jgi:hypothetical protein
MAYTERGQPSGFLTPTIKCISSVKQCPVQVITPLSALKAKLAKSKPGF